MTKCLLTIKKKDDSKISVAKIFHFHNIKPTNLTSDKYKSGTFRGVGLSLNTNFKCNFHNKNELKQF